MSEHWSHEEVEATVADYFDMLAMELRAQPFNKAEHNRNLQRLLNHRSAGAIERKHQNVSAILIEVGYPYVDGYKPLSNYQELLRDVVLDRLNSAVGLQKAAATAVERPIEHPPSIEDVLTMLVNAPKREHDSTKLYERPEKKTQPSVQRNYLEIESRNQTLGLAGEKLILEFEHKRLWEAGKKNLANRIEHVAVTIGDQLGFDVKSFENDGSERLIEVKTTRFGALTPFFASKNQVKVSDEREAEFQLYRLFNFVRQPKLFILPGSLRKSCSLDPAMYTAFLR